MRNLITLTDTEADTVLGALADAATYRAQEAGYWPPEHYNGLCPEPCPAELGDLAQASAYTALARSIAARRTAVNS